MNILNKVIWSTSPLLLEFFNDLTAIAWGLWLLMPWINSFEEVRAFTEMSEIASEGTWGVMLLVIGLVGVFGISRDVISYRRAASLLLTTVWVFIATMLLLSNVSSTGGVVYLLQALGSAIVYIRFYV